MAPDTVIDKPVAEAIETEVTLEGSNDLQLGGTVEVQDDLEIYEDNAEADDLTDSDDEPNTVGRHVRITISKDHRQGANQSEEDENGQGPRKAKMGQTKFSADQANDLWRKTNTPASALTEFSDLKSADVRAESRYLESRDSMFRRAMTLMSKRCVSRLSDRGPLVSREKNPPYGVYGAKYFYVKQNRPTPMPPLKAWRGYNGSVYFEPIQVQNMSVPMERQPSKLRSLISRSQSSRLSNKENLSDTIPNTPSGIKSQMSSVTSTGSVKYRKMCILDKSSVFQVFNENIGDDVIWLKNQESIGSLRMFSKEDGNVSPRAKLEKQKIVKGSVAHRLFEERMRGSHFRSLQPDAFGKPGETAKPTMVNQTQERKLFTPLSNSNCHIPAIGANSPDIEVYSTNRHHDKLPPLDNGQSQPLRPNVTL